MAWLDTRGDGGRRSDLQLGALVEEDPFGLQRPEAAVAVSDVRELREEGILPALVSKIVDRDQRHVDMGV